MCSVMELGICVAGLVYTPPDKTGVSSYSLLGCSPLLWLEYRNWESVDAAVALSGYLGGWK